MSKAGTNYSEKPLIFADCLETSLLRTLPAIGVKATDSIGVYRGKAGPIDVFITLKNARWAKKVV